MEAAEDRIMKYEKGACGRAAQDAGEALNDLWEAFLFEFMNTKFGRLTIRCLDWAEGKLS